jgi:hypothetical protein
MKTKSILGIALGLFAISCGSKDHTQTDGVSGIYVREYSFKVIHAERGDTIGERTIRDTIFIHQKDQSYEVSNHKWSLNDYDNDGWREMEHAEDREIPTYMAIYKQEQNSLISVEETTNILKVDIQNRQVFRGMDKRYRKTDTSLGK